MIICRRRPLYRSQNHLSPLTPGVHVACMLKILYHHCKYKVDQESRRKQGLVNEIACNIHLSDTLWLKKLYPPPKDVMSFSMVSIVSTSCLTPPQNNNQIYCRFRTNYLLHPHQHSQQSNSTCLITSFNQNSCLSSKMKFPSDLYPAITKYLISKFESSQK